MTYIFPLAMVVLMLGVFAALMTQGLWANVLNLFNTITAALVATNFFEPVTGYLTKLVPSGTMFWDFVSLWLIFSLALLILKLASDQVSMVKIRFRRPIDMAGGYLFALWTAYIFIAFTTMTLHTAPLARNMVFGGFRPEDPILFGLKPDRQWLAFVYMVSRGSLAKLSGSPKPANPIPGSEPATEKSETGEPPAFTEQEIHHPLIEFMPKYATRREKYERDLTITGVK